jgi:hypothetical protein
MTNVNITNTTNIVEVTTGNETVVVTAITPGPQGPQGPQGEQIGRLSDLQDVDVTGKVNQGLLYYSTATAKFTVDGTNTVLSLTDGGNF